MTCSSIARRPSSRRSECTAYRLTRAYMAPPPLQLDAWTLQLCRTFMYVGKSWDAAHGGARRSIGRVHSPTSETSNPFETKCSRSGMNPDYRSRASVYLPESICEAKGGVGCEKQVADCHIRTPPRKIRARFRGYKHRSLVLLAVESSRVRRCSAQKPILVAVFLTHGRRS